MFKRCIGGTAACWVGLLASVASAGPLNPPPGAVAPTMKTLDEVEPRIPLSSVNTPGDANSTYRITRPGSYYLTATTEVTAAGVGGIEIASDSVTIDLMGHSLRGRGEAHHGIFSESAVGNVTIRNGTVTGFWMEGVRLPASSGEGSHLLEDLHVSNNGGGGISAGAGAIVRGCTAAENGAVGISVGSNSVVDRCVARDNGGHGVASGARSVITNVTAEGNDAAGVSTSDTNVVSQVAARGNATSGIVAGPGSDVSHCAVIMNEQHGILAMANVTLSHCNARGNAFDGISTASSSVAITNCTAHGNARDGIRVQDRGIVRDSACMNNSFSGIRVEGSFGRVEGNHCASNPTGYLVEDTNNVVVRNTCTDSAVTFNITGNNLVGEIINIPGGGLFTASAWANMVH